MNYRGYRLRCAGNTHSDAAVIVNSFEAELSEYRMIPARFLKDLACLAFNIRPTFHAWPLIK